MATTLQTVWDDLVDAIEGIRVADGYHYTVQHVTTQPTSLLNLGLTPAVVLWWDAGRSTTAPSALGDVYDEVLAFAADWRIDQPSLAERDRREALGNWRADLERAVLADCSRGGVAWDTEIVDGSGGPWMDANGVMLGSSLITVRVARTRGDE